MHPLAFEVRDVTYRYNQVTALDRVTIEARQGERVALLGANGSGKSTLLRVLAGLYFPEKGEVFFRGDRLTERRLEDEALAFDFRRRVGLLFQNPDVQLFNATVFDELAFGPLQLRWPKEAIRKKVESMLELMGIARLKDRPPHRLSGGEKKRVALASVLILDPDVLLLDEPDAALDPKSQSQILNFLVSWGGGAKTVITATHDLESVAEIADRCYIFQNGSIAAEGTPRQILSDAQLLERTGLIHHRGAGPSPAGSGGV